MVILWPTHSNTWNEELARHAQRIGCSVPVLPAPDLYEKFE
jgi:hypothetical protein